MHRPGITLTVTCLGLALLAHSASVDAMARSRDTRTRLHAPEEVQSTSTGEVMPRAKIRVRARKRGTEMTVALRRLEANAEHLLYCDALGQEPIRFMTNARGRVRLRGLQADAGERGDMFGVEVHNPDGFVVLEGELEHPGHHDAHGREHAQADERHSPIERGSEHQPGAGIDGAECDDPSHEHVEGHSLAGDASHEEACDVDREHGTGDPVHGHDDEPHDDMPGHDAEDAPHGGARSHDDAASRGSVHGPHHQ